MAEAKTFASLSPRLLARKGGAKPAMRPQFQPLDQFSATEASLGDLDDGNEDLGWNDMGESRDELEEAQDTATVLPFAGGEGGFEAAPLTTGLPEVVRRQDALAGKIEAGKRQSAKIEAARLEVSAAPIALAAHRRPRAEALPVRRSALAEGRRAAFTLRLDSERHLKLRLACTVQGRSAQQLVTEALDRLFEGLPELEDLARRVKRR